MTQARLIYLSIVLLLFYGCQEGKDCDVSEKPQSIKFEDLVDTKKIDSVRISNNSGTHIIKDKAQYELFSMLNSSVLVDGSFKMGSIYLAFFIDGKAYGATGRDEGQYIEFNSSIITKNNCWVEQDWIYFDINKLNLHNF